MINKIKCWLGYHKWRSVSWSMLPEFSYKIDRPNGYTDYYTELKVLDKVVKCTRCGETHEYEVPVHGNINLPRHDIKI